MRILVDTNLLLRQVQKNHPTHVVSRRSVYRLRRAGHEIIIVPQIIYEFWVVATRPVAVNGLGLNFDSVYKRLRQIRRFYQFENDTTSLYRHWIRLVRKHQTSGKSAHDARLVAAMAAHRITHLLTFNTQDFQRYANIAMLDPNDVMSA